MKKIFFIAIILVICSFECVHTATNSAMRIDTYSNLTDGSRYYYTAYDIEGYKVFQIEDIAAILNGTSGNFDVTNDLNTYTVKKNTAYTGKSSKSPHTDSKIPFYESQDVNFIADEVVSVIKSYDIDGCKYFKIGDLTDILGFSVEWNSEDFTFTFYDTDDKSELITVAMLSVEQLEQIENNKLEIRVLDPDKPMIALTFDDGPKKESTERILAALKKVGGRATFFVVGEMAAKNPELIKAEAEAGCQIGNHTYSHVNLSKATEYTVRSEIAKTSNLVYELTGKYTMVGRPPYGSINDTVRKVINIPWFNWNIDTLDWKNKDAEYVEDFVIENAKDGAIMLLHDLHNTTAEAMEKAIPELSKEYQLVTINELIEYKYNGDATKVPGYVK